MSVYKRKLRSGKRSRWYSAEFEYRGKPIRKGGFPDRDSAKQWAMAEMLKLRRNAVGYVKPMLAAKVLPLVHEFADKLRSRGRDDMYAYTSEKRLERLAGECGWLTLANVTRESLETWMSGSSEWRGKAIGARTKNQYAATALEWGKWLAHPKVGKLPANPFVGIDLLPAKHNDQYRRAATLDELEKLLATCPAERRLYYLFRIYTPMRADTIGRLTWRMLHLDAAPPFAKTPAELNKSKREEKHTIRYDVAQQLRSVKGKGDALVFAHPPTVDDLREDWKTAGVAFDDGKGNRRLDFHALRRTLIKLAKASGLSLDQASLLLGHRDPRTTAKYYDEDSISPDLGRSIEQLPALGKIRRAQ